MNIKPKWADELWPYSAEQLSKIEACLQTRRQRCIDQIVHAARVFAALKTGPQKKPQPAEEIAVVKASAIDFYGALSRLSSEAEDHLATHWEKANGEIQGDRLTREALLRLLHRFIHENASGFDSLPAAPSRGPIVKKDEAWLVWQFQLAFTAGHDGKFPARGWQKFLELCWQPIRANKLAAPLSERSIKRKLGEARQYFSSINSK
jgi:hypothetical protein